MSHEAIQTGGCVDRLTEHGERIAALETSQRHMEALFGDAERRILVVIAELKSIMEIRFTALEHAIRGNGKPGLEGRVSALERQGVDALEDRIAMLEHQDALDKGQREAGDRLFNWLKPFIPWILAVAGMALTYFITKAGKQ